MSCPTAVIKYLVFIFNSLCALIGIGTIVVNALALRDIDQDGRLVCIFMIVLASIVFVISFFGCCGAIRESTCMIWMYAVFMLLLLIANCVLTFGYLKHLHGQRLAHKTIEAAWTQQLNGTDAMAVYQTKLHCCGKFDSIDYISAGIQVPPSCHSDGNTDNMTTLYRAGCINKLIATYNEAERLIKIFSWISLGVESVALIFALILAVTFRNQQRRARY